MKTVGEFKVTQSGTQILQLMPRKNISWSEDSQRTSPPADTPPCGFNFEFCPTSTPSKWQEIYFHKLFVELIHDSEEHLG